MTPFRNPVFVTHNGAPQFYVIRAARQPTDEDCGVMMTLAAAEFPALFDFQGQKAFQVRDTLAGIRAYVARLEQGGVKVSNAVQSPREKERLLSEAVPGKLDPQLVNVYEYSLGSDKLDDLRVLLVGIALDANARLSPDNGSFTLEDNVIALGNGGRVEILLLWSGKLKDGEQAWLYTLAAVTPRATTATVEALAPPVATAATPVPAGPRCNECGQPANFACGRCGAFCCEQHLDRMGVWRQYGAVCSQCASTGCLWLVVSLSIVGIGGMIALAVLKH